MRTAAQVVHARLPSGSDKLRRYHRMDRRKRMTARISLLALTLLGCNNSAATAVEDVPAEQAAALCDLFLRCGVATDEALCAGNLWSTFIITGEFLPNIASVRAAIERGSVIYHEEHLEACLVDIRETACTRKDFWQIASDALGSSCDQVFEGTLAEGEPCWIREQCVSGSCDAPYCELACCEGVCAPARVKAAIGESCAEARCVAGAYCVATTCVARQPSGAACAPPEGHSFGDECIEGTLCDSNGDGTGTCRPLPALGEPCVQGQCADLGASCDYTMGICVEIHAEGESCDPSGYGVCGLSLRCDPDRKTCERMTAGGPCSLGPFGYDCAPGAYCQDFTCEVQKADGAPCESALACQSLHCDPVERVCADAPVCGP